jgi:4-hydroxy-3-polyprenylbenzoate decarboxylase
MRNLVVAITGASGSLYAVRLLEVLLAGGDRVHLTISPSGAVVLKQELDLTVDLDHFAPEKLLPSGAPAGGAIVYHHYQDFSAGIASGSFLTDGMVVCPCSMGTLASLASGHSSNLIQRAADVHLKERRKLIVVPRETPLGSIQLDNMKRLADAGAVILPAMPGFYQRPQTIHDLADFIVGRICDQLGIRHELFKRWGG